MNKDEFINKKLEGVCVFSLEWFKIKKLIEETWEVAEKYFNEK